MPGTNNFSSAEKLEGLRKELENSYRRLRGLLNNKILEHPTRSSKLEQIMADFLRQCPIVIGDYLTEISEDSAWFNQNVDAFQDRTEKCDILKEIRKSLVEPLNAFLDKHVTEQKKGTYKKQIPASMTDKIAEELHNSSQVPNSRNKISPDNVKVLVKEITDLMTDIASSTKKYLEQSIDTSAENSSLYQTVQDYLNGWKPLPRTQDVQGCLRRTIKDLTSKLAVSTTLGIDPDSNNKDCQKIRDGISAFKVLAEFKEILDKVSLELPIGHLRSLTLEASKASCDEATQRLAYAVCAGKTRAAIRNIFCDSILKLCCKEDYIAKHGEFQRVLLQYLKAQYAIEQNYSNTLPINTLARDKNFTTIFVGYFASHFAEMPCLEENECSEVRGLARFAYYLRSVYETLERLNERTPVASPVADASSLHGSSLPALESSSRSASPFLCDVAAADHPGFSSSLAHQFAPSASSECDKSSALDLQNQERSKEHYPFDLYSLIYEQDMQKSDIEQIVELLKHEIASLKQQLEVFREKTDRIESERDFLFDQIEECRQAIGKLAGNVSENAQGVQEVLASSSEELKKITDDIGKIQESRVSSDSSASIVINEIKKHFAVLQEEHAEHLAAVKTKHDKELRDCETRLQNFNVNHSKHISKITSEFEELSGTYKELSQRFEQAQGALEDKEKAMLKKDKEIAEKEKLIKILKSELNESHKILEEASESHAKQLSDQKTESLKLHKQLKQIWEALLPLQGLISPAGTQEVSEAMSSKEPFEMTEQYDPEIHSEHFLSVINDLIEKLQNILEKKSRTEHELGEKDKELSKLQQSVEVLKPKADTSIDSVADESFNKMQNDMQTKSQHAFTLDPISEIKIVAQALKFLEICAQIQDNLPKQFSYEDKINTKNNRTILEITLKSEKQAKSGSLEEYKEKLQNISTAIKQLTKGSSNDAEKQQQLPDDFSKYPLLLAQDMLRRLHDIIVLNNKRCRQESLRQQAEASGEEERQSTSTPNSSKSIRAESGAKQSAFDDAGSPLSVTKDQDFYSFYDAPDTPRMSLLHYLSPTHCEEESKEKQSGRDGGPDGTSTSRARALTEFSTGEEDVYEAGAEKPGSPPSTFVSASLGILPFTDGDKLPTTPEQQNTAEIVP
ncbi:hypothetical protein RLOatenuis_0950 [Rickettsiales bacterium]|nr:hypothetical protein RLOatenuis_0950 [Rickettsiales bacterium]